MTNIYFQEKLTKLYRLDKFQYSPECAMFHWDAEIMELDETTYILFQDDTDSGYCFACVLPKKMSRTQFGDFFLEGLISQLEYEGILVDKDSFKSNTLSGITTHSYYVNGEKPSKSILMTMRKIEKAYTKCKDVSSIVASFNSQYSKKSRFNPDKLSSTLVLCDWMRITPKNKN